VELFIIFLFYVNFRCNSPEGEKYDEGDTQSHHRDDVAYNIQGVDHPSELQINNDTSYLFNLI